MKQLRLSLANELIVDLFAGGGGASMGIEMATGRMVDIAINHDPEAVAMHMANHPTTKHCVSDVFEVDPVTVCGGQPVGLLWASPDCKHHSKAKGGKPRDKKIRSLAWVVIRWAKTVKPRVICLENVEEFQDWGPLDDDGYPIKSAKGRTFRTWVQRLEHLGYRVEFRQLRACDYGAPTTRKRLFVIARRDGRPIVWPEPTHGDPNKLETKKRKLKPWRTAAECIDWSIPCPSIFERERPLADATMRRIAKGLMRYVVNSPKPFIVPDSLAAAHITKFRTGATGSRINDPVPTVTAGGEPVRPAGAPHALGLVTAKLAPFVSTYYGQKSPDEVRGIRLDQPLQTQTTENRHALVAPFITEHANASSPRSHNAAEPLRTICAQVKGGYFALVSAFLAKHYGGNCTNPASALDVPTSTVTAIDHHGLVTANLVHMGHGEQSASGAPRWSHGVRDITDPLNTVTASSVPAGLVTSNLVKLRNNCIGQDQREPMHTVTGGAGHFAEVRAFLVKYYGVGQEVELTSPLHTVTSKDRFGLVTVQGQEYAIVDIGLRMLAPRELFRAQGFPDDYIIDRGADGRKLSKTAQVRMCGNSVCPPIAAALVRANYRELELLEVA